MAWLALAAFAAQAPATATPAPPLDAHRIALARFGNDAPWYEDRIPFIETSDPQLDAVYYYRWALFRAHQRDLGAAGYISTEFLDDVGWQREPYASLNDASGFHIGEGRWLRDRRYAADYIDYMYRGGDDLHFSDYLQDAVWGRYLVDGDRAEALRHLSAMRHLYGAWDDHYDWAKRLYWIEPLLDATEYTISSIDASGGADGFRGGDAFRPTINAYMFANARALAGLTALAGDADASADYAARAEDIRQRVQADLWSAPLGHFIDRYKVGNAQVKYWQPIRGRELAGYVPWAFDLPADDTRYAVSWRRLLSGAGFAAPAGLRTVEPSYPYYMRQYRYEGTHPECQWNGPVWPFQTTQVLLGMINLLDHYHQSVVDRTDFMRLLRQYARLHYQGGRLDLEEDYDPATGKPIVGLARSHHYFHSGFVDLVLTGLVGIRPRADDVLEINPLVPATGAQALRWFRADRIPYHGHLVAVRWDADGSRYGGGPGLKVSVDGRDVATIPKLGRLTVPLQRLPTSRIDHSVDRAVQLVRGEFPKPSASGANDPEALHEAVDGRVWFFPEAPNGWVSSPSPKPQWFAVDFGKNVNVSQAELAFAGGDGARPPSSYALQYWAGGAWHELAASKGAAILNGITRADWTPLETSRIRVVVRVRRGHAIRLVEVKVF